MGYLAVLVIAFVMHRPWRYDLRFANARAVAAAEGRYPGPVEPNWLATTLASRLDDDTLVVLALSGGGSRAAYFDSAVLEQLAEIKVRGRTGRRVSLDVFLDIIRPHRTIATLTGLRPPVAALADAIDRHLFSDRDLPFGSLRARERQGAPLLIVNATDTETFGLLAFIPGGFDRNLYAVTQRPSASGVRAPLAGTPIPDVEPRLAAYDWSRGDLDVLRVSDAVAASAAYPLLGEMRLLRYQEISRLGDAGLVDNSGLLSLYAQPLTRQFFDLTANRLQRILVLAINAGDAGLEGSWFGPVRQVNDIYAQAQQNVQRFIVPETVRRIADQDLADVFARPEWKSFEFPEPIVFTYGECRGTDRSIGTRLHLSADAQAALKRAARRCVHSAAKAAIVNRFDAEPAPSGVYRGIISPNDETAWHWLFRVASAEREWRRRYGRWVTTEDLQRTEISGTIDGARRTVPFNDRIPLPTPASSGFVFETTIVGDALQLRATPVRHGDTGWLSLFLELRPDPPPPSPTDTALQPEVEVPGETAVQRALRGLAESARRQQEETERRGRERIRACLALGRQFRGGDLGGAKAGPDSPVFAPYSFSTSRPCF